MSETAAYVNAEMAGTSLTAANQAAATAAGNAAIAEDQAANPAGYLAQCAASNYPSWSSAVGTSIVASAVGCKPDGTQNPWAGWGIYALIALGVGVVWLVIKQ